MAGIRDHIRKRANNLIRNLLFHVYGIRGCVISHPLILTVCVMKYDLLFIPDCISMYFLKNRFLQLFYIFSKTLLIIIFSVFFPYFLVSQLFLLQKTVFSSFLFLSSVFFVLCFFCRYFLSFFPAFSFFNVSGYLRNL